MLYQILIKTPLYVWAILAFLVYRGAVSSRDRDMSTTRMLVIPLVMLVLSLQSIASQFGANPAAIAAWTVGAGAMMLQRWTFGGKQLTRGAAPGTVRVRGNWMPLFVMMVIFVTKYVSAVMLVIQPRIGQDALFALTTSSLLGLCSGYFLGQLVRDIATCRALREQAPAASPAGC